MKKYISALLIAFSFAVHAMDKPKTHLDGPRFNFREINVAQVVQLIYSEALKDAFVIDPEVLTDQRAVTFRYDPSRGDLHTFIASFFDSLGLAVVRKNGVDFVTRKQPSTVVPEVRDVFVYRPRYRDGSYLVDLLSPLFNGKFTARRAIHAAVSDKSPQSMVPPDSAAAMIDRRSDTLVFAGSMPEIELLKKLLAQVDKSAGDVIVRGVLYEIQNASTDGSGFSLALSLLGGKLGVRVGTSTHQGNAITFTNSTIDAAISALSSDNRFTVRSTPTLRVSSGQTGRFTVGEDVPVLGAVTYTGTSGAPVQSIEYRSSGVIFDLLPTLHDDAVDLTVMQQMSNFVMTSNGVNNSPTLIKRELKTTLSLLDGEIVVIGGLAENKEVTSRNGFSFLPSFMHTKSSDKSTTEILLILQITRI